MGIPPRFHQPAGGLSSTTFSSGGSVSPRGWHRSSLRPGLRWVAWEWLTQSAVLQAGFPGPAPHQWAPKLSAGGQPASAFRSVQVTLIHAVDWNHGSAVFWRTQELYTHRKQKHRYHTKIPYLLEWQVVRQQLGAQLLWSPRVAGEAERRCPRTLAPGSAYEKGETKRQRIRLTTGWKMGVLFGWRQGNARIGRSQAWPWEKGRIGSADIWLKRYST